MSTIYTDDIADLIRRTKYDAGWSLTIRTVVYDTGRMQVEVWDLTDPKKTRIIAKRVIDSDSRDGGWPKTRGYVGDLLDAFQAAVQP